jgi:hypothetical protein
MSDSWLAKLLKRLQIASRFIKPRKSSGRTGTSDAPKNTGRNLFVHSFPLQNHLISRSGNTCVSIGLSIEQRISQQRRRLDRLGCKSCRQAIDKAFLDSKNRGFDTRLRWYRQSRATRLIQLVHPEERSERPRETRTWRLTATHFLLLGYTCNHSQILMIY